MIKKAWHQYSHCHHSIVIYTPSPGTNLVLSTFPLCKTQVLSLFKVEENSAFLCSYFWTFWKETYFLKCMYLPSHSNNLYEKNTVVQRVMLTFGIPKSLLEWPLESRLLCSEVPGKQTEMASVFEPLPPTQETTLDVWVPGFSLTQFPGVVSIWGVNQQREHLCPCSSSPLLSK